MTFRKHKGKSYLNTVNLSIKKGCRKRVKFAINDQHFIKSAMSKIFFQKVEAWNNTESNNEVDEEKSGLI